MGRIVSGALMVNLILFIGLPNLLLGRSVTMDIENLHTVDVLNESPTRRSVEKDRPPDRPRPPEPPRVMPRRVRTSAQPQPKPQLNMEMPPLRFDVSPELAMGVPVSPSEPVPAQSPAHVASKMVMKSVYGEAEVDQAPLATVRTRPVYPYRARRLNLNGSVDVRFLVDAQGRVSQITILQAKPPKLFDENVLKALDTWRFSPGKVNGRPVSTWVTTTIEFKIDE
jgi:protein TonB